MRSKSILRSVLSICFMVFMMLYAAVVTGVTARAEGEIDLNMLGSTQVLAEKHAYWKGGHFPSEFPAGTEDPVFGIFELNSSHKFTELKEGRDYEVISIQRTISRGNSVDVTGKFDKNLPGDYTFKIEGKGNYTGIAVVETFYLLDGNNLQDLNVSIQKANLISGEQPVVLLKDASGAVKKLSKGVDYKVTSVTKDNKSTSSRDYRAPGYYYMYIEGIGQYTGSVYVDFTVKPKGTTIKKVSAVSKGFKVTWSKSSSTNASGYQIRYSLKSSMANAKTVKVKGYATTSKKVTKLKAKKKYYVQIRTYKSAGGNTYYSAWSAKKSVTTK